jgi:DNA-binding beta-propeller fold protein YncE
MRNAMRNTISKSTWRSGVVIALAMLLVPAMLLGADKKKKNSAPAQPELAPDPLVMYDLSKIVWPNAPAITRIKFITQFTGEKIDLNAPKTVKSKWMDRLAGVSADSNPQTKPRHALGQPWGVAVDSKGLVYVGDQKVGAIFIFNTETRDLELIRNGREANFSLITGLAIDDMDRLFVADANLHVVQMFDKDHKLQGRVREGLDQPVGVAIDNENRQLYVADSGMDQVLVYDLDTFKLKRKMGTSGKNHTLTEPGQFSRPAGVAVDSDGDVYVTDNFNTRVEIFDADGNFISTFGKAGDGPGYFARPKGIAIDRDNHIWVVDSVQNRVQVFDKEGHLLIYFGGPGNRPGEMMVPEAIAIDNNNRVFTTEQYPGRLQEFRYVADEEAMAEKKRREEIEAKNNGTAKTAEAAKPAEAKPEKQEKTGVAAAEAKPLAKN